MRVAHPTPKLHDGGADQFVPQVFAHVVAQVKSGWPDHGACPTRTAEDGRHLLPIFPRLRQV